MGVGPVKVDYAPTQGIHFDIGPLTAKAKMWKMKRSTPSIFNFTSSHLVFGGVSFSFQEVIFSEALRA